MAPLSKRTVAFLCIVSSTVLVTSKIVKLEYNGISNDPRLAPSHCSGSHTKRQPVFADGVDQEISETGWVIVLQYSSSMIPIQPASFCLNALYRGVMDNYHSNLDLICGNMILEWRAGTDEEIPWEVVYMFA
ncbi:hypothetical protein MMC22_008856 [Lobaria immixta]|nr:hypothetical protein [Lobaria immixta]